ncbi:hypothetical protein EJ02DRAFT_466369 [Clathrospora elynae]|uniref:Uncharacterized protein n=1 Tax=Clathrospora elynae TaxID=706981 RepID=A0A6A5SPT8_9PLEO|nr:hypothetical protein EJ02DRAFT_466369 [Clathrospora elynae]
MLYNPGTGRAKERLTAILVADLTPTQLDTVQDQFGLGANLCCPIPGEELFITDKRSWSTKSHADPKRAYPDTSPLLVIDARTPSDGGIYIGNTDIREDLDTVNVPYLTPEDFDQDDVFKSDFDYVKDRYLSPTWVIASPEEIESSTNAEDLKNFSPPPEIVWRLKEGVARQHGLKSRWTLGSEPRDGEEKRPDGTVIAFPGGSKILQCEYDPEMAVPGYARPEGSLTPWHEKAVCYISPFTLVKRRGSFVTYTALC